MQAEAREKAKTERPTEKAKLALGEWIPTVSSGYSNPRHLQPLLDLFARIKAGETVRAVVDAPPRHAKTETMMHAVPWMLEDLPRTRFGYFTYSDSLSAEKSRVARRVAETAGIQLEKNAEDQWETNQGGGLVAGSIGGTFTGRGVNVLLMDDLFKNRQEADSALIRERRWEWWQSVAATRLEKPSGSAIACGTRWHPDDVQGRLLKEGWEHIHLPALDEAGRALWPERFTEKDFAKVRAEVGEYNFLALYMGNPRHRGGQVFGEPRVWTKLPENGLRYVIGLDAAYSEKSHADYSVAVVLAYDGLRAYVLQVVRVQLEAPKFKAQLRALCYSYPTARLLFMAAGIEKGIVDFFRTPDADPSGKGKALPGINVEFKSAREDKFQRAQPVAAAWNDPVGRVLVPADAPWLNTFLGELADFTGIADRKDDQVDALSAAWELIAQPMPTHGARDQGTATRRRM